MSAAPGPITIGQWALDAELCELREGDKVVRLEPKACEVLAHLATRPGRVVGREELLSQVWPGVIVGDDALTQAIIKLRKALGDDAHDPRYIETISKRGYRLIAPVREAGAPAAQAPRGEASVTPSKALLLVAAGFAAALILTVTNLPISKHAPMPWPIGADTRGGAPASLPIVAVLPLANLSGDAAREYFCDGMTEDIIVALGRFSGVRVMSRNAVQEFRKEVPSPQVLRERLGARYIVQGTVRESAGRVRVAVELTDAEKGTQLWAERYEGEGAEVFEIQDRIVKQVVGALHVKLSQLEKERAFRKPTESLEAYELVLQARERVAKMDRRANREARTLLARAAELSPAYADVLIVQGEAEMQRALYGWVEDPSQPLRRAEELANRALSSSDTRAHARAHYLLSRVYSNLARPHEALAHAERAVGANPSDTVAGYWHGASLMYAGRIDEGVAAMEAARRLDPLLSEGNGLNLVVGYYTAGRYREALALADQLVARFPRDVSIASLRAATLAQLGEEEGARQAAGQVRRLNPAFNIEFTGQRFANPAHRAKLQDGLQKAGL